MSPHKSNDAGSFRIDKRFAGVGRIALASGTTDAKTYALYVGMLDQLYAAGRLDILAAVKRRQVTVREVWTAFRPVSGRGADLNRLPSPESMQRLWDTADGRETGALERWIAGHDVTDTHRQNLRRDARLLRRVAGAGDAVPTATVADLPALLEKARKRCLAATPQPRRRIYNMTRNSVLAFLRATLGRTSHLYATVAEMPPLAERRKATSGLAPADARAVQAALAETSPGAAAAWWALCVSGMRPAELWQEGTASWALLPDRLRIAASKVEGRAPRDVPALDPSALAGVPPIGRDRVQHLLWALSNGEPPFARPWTRRVTMYDGRRTFIHWLEIAGVPRTRRKLYQGHTSGDVTDLYERHEVDTYLADDARKVRALLALTDPPAAPALRLA